MTMFNPRTSAIGAALLATLGCNKPSTQPPAEKLEWQLLASELPSALLSVSGRSAADMFAVGADKGRGPLVLHFDGKAWRSLHTGGHPSRTPSTSTRRL